MMELDIVLGMIFPSKVIDDLWENLSDAEKNFCIHQRKSKHGETVFRSIRDNNCILKYANHSSHGAHFIIYIDGGFKLIQWPEKGKMIRIDYGSFFNLLGFFPSRMISSNVRSIIENCDDAFSK